MILIRLSSLAHSFLKRLPLLLSPLLLWVLYATLTIITYSHRSDEQPASAIIVLGAGLFGDQPSLVFQERINHALKLYEAGYTPLIIFTGGLGVGKTITEAEAAQAYARQHGLPAEAMLLETQSRSTEQNLYYAKKLALEHGLENFILVSDPLHQKRAMSIAQDMGLTVYSSPTQTSRYKSWRAWGNFLGREVYYYTRYILRRPFFQFEG